MLLRAPAEHCLKGCKENITCVEVHFVFTVVCSRSEDTAVKVRDCDCCCQNTKLFRRASRVSGSDEVAIDACNDSVQYSLHSTSLHPSSSSKTTPTTPTTPPTSASSGSHTAATMSPLQHPYTTRRRLPRTQN
mmetsp:Transcript_64043/g.75809  ORF Transcript_64043/g.75809 Transcript_64043/m.75809 type:complete len:133 (-) Transcript_64043:774-1172(-)